MIWNIIVLTCTAWNMFFFYWYWHNRMWLKSDAPYYECPICHRKVRATSIKNLTVEKDAVYLRCQCGIRYPIVTGEDADKIINYNKNNLTK